jgi:hypothetical protein
MQGTELAKSEAPQFDVGESIWRPRSLQRVKISTVVSVVGDTSEAIDQATEELLAHLDTHDELVRVLKMICVELEKRPLTKRSRHHLTGRGFHKLIRDTLKRSREWPWCGNAHPKFATERWLFT